MHYTGAKHKVRHGHSHNYGCYSLFLTVGKPAPDWNGTAVVEDPPLFKEIKLLDFKGNLKYID